MLFQHLRKTTDGLSLQAKLLPVTLHTSFRRSAPELEGPQDLIDLLKQVKDFATWGFQYCWILTPLQTCFVKRLPPSLLYIYLDRPISLNEGIPTVSSCACLLLQRHRWTDTTVTWYSLETSLNEVNVTLKLMTVSLLFEEVSPDFSSPTEIK